MHITSRSIRLAAVVSVAVVALAGCAATASGSAPSEDPAADYPSGPLTYVVPYNPGGSTDPVGREYSRLLAAELGTTEVVENLPGGDETIGLSRVITADPDGQTLGLSSATGIIVQPLVNPDLPFQTVDDYTPVVKMVEAPNGIVVGADSPFKTLDDLVSAAKERPGEITVGTTGRLTNNTFVLVSLEEQAGIDLNIVPFSGGAGEAVTAAIGGQIDAALPTIAGQLGLIQSGELRLLAHTGDERYTEVMDGVESFTDAGYDIPFSSDYITVAAPGLDDAVREKLAAAAFDVASSEEWEQWCAEKGFLADPMEGDDLLEWIATVTAASETAIDLVEANLE